MIGTRLTLAGAVMLSKAIAGKQLVFTRGAFGDAKINGQMVEPTDEEQDNLCNLINERMSLPIYAVEPGDPGDLIITVKVKNSEVETKFKTAEAGIFALDPDSGTESLYAYCYEGADGDTIYPHSSACIIEYYDEFITTIGNAANVTAIVNIKEKIKAGVGLSRMGDTINFNYGGGLGVDSLNNVNLLTGSASQIGGFKVGKNLYTSGDSLNASGGELEGRVNQLEINLANAFMKLNANNLDATANLWVVEDWKNNNATDLFKVDVGDGTLTDNSLMLVHQTSCPAPGQVVTIACRGKSQEVQITNVAGFANDDGTKNFHLIFDRNISADLLEDGSAVLIANGHIYRTTAGVADGYAYGPGNIKRNYSYLTEWAGEHKVDSYSYAITPLNQVGATITGDGDWDGDYFAII